jgi:hypothetical protein
VYNAILNRWQFIVCKGDISELITEEKRRSGRRRRRRREKEGRREEEVGWFCFVIPLRPQTPKHINNNNTGCYIRAFP